MWKDDFDSMARKTVLKQILSKYGPLSIDMQKAIEYDQMDSNGNYADNGGRKVEIVEAEIGESEEERNSDES